MRLAGRHALVTGGGTGIGAAIARALAAEGARLTLVGRRRDRLEEIAAGLPGSLVAPADVTETEGLERAFALAREAQGPIDLLVNNAGMAESRPFERTDAGLWRAMMAVNLDGPFNACRLALADIRASAAGRIVNIASTAGLRPYLYSAAYVAAKHGLVGLTRALALELARSRATVNAVCPGFTESDLSREAIDRIRSRTGRSEEEARASLAAFNPQQRLVTPEEVANAVLWLCLPESQAMNGQAVVVAGGEVM